MQDKNAWHKTLFNKTEADIWLDSEAKHQEAERNIAALFLIILNIEEQKLKILDVPCGIGRYAHKLAQAGHEVTGVDINPELIARAEKNCPPGLTLKIGNMANLNWATGQFDLVLNMYNSFGYFATDEENENVLREFVKALKPGGRLVLENYLSSAWPEENKLEESEEKIKLTHTKLDPDAKNVVHVTVSVNKKTSAGEYFSLRQRLYSCSEMLQLMQKVGLKNNMAFDAVTLEPPGQNSLAVFFIGTA